MISKRTCIVVMGQKHIVNSIPILSSVCVYLPGQLPYPRFSHHILGELGVSVLEITGRKSPQVYRLSCTTNPLLILDFSVALCSTSWFVLDSATIASLEILPWNLIDRKTEWGIIISRKTASRENVQQFHSPLLKIMVPYLAWNVSFCLTIVFIMV